ncbi:FUSC family protein [Segeticoccus rhizosphaerae]|uniref:FUSC family protein n=1 Tax=Segeticoccus rhizosphaerae TaxID=1104777 RepID=UPI0010C0CAF3|nr:FUSC family protein [Ornithinicoccus soli]
MSVRLPSARGELRDARDRLVASDPGGTRLRQAARATVVVASTLVVERVVAWALGAQPLMLMLLGAIVTIPMSTGIRDTRGALVLRTAVLSPVASAVGVSLAVIAGQQHVLGLVLFVIVVFTAVWVRRFGPRWFHYGFLLWQSYFFALFLSPPVSALPSLLVAVVCATVWVALLLATVLHDDPEARLRRTITALRARARAVVSTCLDVLDDPGDRGARRALRAHRIQLGEAVLLLDGQLSDERALPDGVPPGRLRRWIVDFEIGMDRLCSAVLDLAADPGSVPRRQQTEVRDVLRQVAWAHPEAALAGVQRLEREGATPVSRRIARAGRLLVDTVDQWDSGALRLGPDAEEAHDSQDGDFESVVRLTGGNLPGVASLAERSVRSDGAGRWSPSRLRLTTRQAIQAGTAAALAILAGELISSQRYYWAVIAAFVGFAGTATAGETLRKGVARVFGTVAGLVVAVGLANLTADTSTLALVTTLACVFLAFYLQAVSYGAMIFFITVLLGQLYTMLHSLVDQLLLIRLEETAIGALIGIGVSFLVLPAGTRATLRAARAAFLEHLADLLEAAADALSAQDPRRDLLALTIELDAASRQVLRTERGLTYGRFFGAVRTGIRHRVTMLGVCAAAGRALAAALSTERPTSTPLADTCRELVAECRRLSAARQLYPPPELPEGTLPVAERVEPLLATAEREAGGPAPKPTATVTSLVAILRRLTQALTLLGHEPSRRQRPFTGVGGSAGTGGASPRRRSQ